jgi:hypothetical protein
VRIPSGDLAPARKHRRYGRRRNPLPVLAAVVLVLAIAAIGYRLHREDKGAGAVTATARCATTAPAPKSSKAGAPSKLAAVRLPAPAQVSFRLLNGTGRSLLARSVGNELARRGFHVSGMGNSPRPLGGASRVYYGPGGRPAALLVTAHVLGATVEPVPSAPHGALDVVLGSSFVRLRTAAETTAFARGLATGAVPVASKPVAPAPAPSPSPTCR